MKVKSSSKYRLCMLGKRWTGGETWGILLDIDDDALVVGEGVLHFKRSTVVYEGSKQLCLHWLGAVSEHVEVVEQGV